jgi:hypothetical protein
MKFYLLTICLVFHLMLEAQIVRDSTRRNPVDSNAQLKVRFTDDVLLFNAGLKKDSSGIKGSTNLTISGYVDVYYGFTPIQQVWMVMKSSRHRLRGARLLD